MKLIFKNVFSRLAIFSILAIALVLVSTPNMVKAATGEGTATIGGGTSQVVVISTSNTLSVVLTVGATGIATDAAGPTFTIPTGFTAPHAAGGASVPTNPGEVDVDGEWFIAGAGGTCAVTMASSSATGQVITADVTGACATTNTITLTYKGVAPSSAMAATNFDVKTADTLANGAATSITTTPAHTIVVKGTSVFANHNTAGVATTNNLLGLAQVGGTDKVLGGFKITAAGEDVTVTTVRTTVTLGGGMTIAKLTNLRIAPDDGTGGGVANDGTMQAGELAAALATIASPVSGNNDFTLSTTVTGGSSKNYFLVGTIASTVVDTNSVAVQATGAGSVSTGVTSLVSITSTGTTSNSTMAVTDTTAPTVTSVSPANTSIGQDRINAVVINFSEPMTTGTFAITGTTFGTPVWSNSNATVSLPHNTFNTNQLYTLNITVATDASAALNSIAGLPYTWSFTTSSSGTSGGGTTTPVVPSNTSLSINAGATSVNSEAVTLTLGATNAVSMIISNNPFFSGSSWETYATSKSWTLASGNGSKTVYVKFISSTGNESEPISKNITVNSSSTTPPVVPNPTPTPTPPTQGCSGGNQYNVSTGALCVNNAGPEIPGCGNRTTGFSTSSGVSCVGNRTNESQGSSDHSGPYNFGPTTLKNGSRGEGVMELQRFLNRFLNLGLSVDGKLGPKTIAVIKKWQKENGLVADGLIGAKTKLKMNSMVQ